MISSEMKYNLFDRLDFETFSVTGPVTADSRCLQDRFSVTSPGNVAPSVICGTNSGLHSKQIITSFSKYAY